MVEGRVIRESGLVEDIKILAYPTHIIGICHDGTEIPVRNLGRYNSKCYIEIQEEVCQILR